MTEILDRCLKTAADPNATDRDLGEVCQQLSELTIENLLEIDTAKKVVSALVRNPSIAPRDLLSLGQPYDLLFEYIADLNNNPAIDLILVENPDFPILVAKIYKSKFYVTARECFPDWFEPGLECLRSSDRCCRCDQIAFGKNFDGYPLCRQHLEELKKIDSPVGVT